MMEMGEVFDEGEKRKCVSVSIEEKKEERKEKIRSERKKKRKKK